MSLVAISHLYIPLLLVEAYNLIMHYRVVCCSAIPKARLLHLQWYFILIDTLAIVASAAVVSASGAFPRSVIVAACIIAAIHFPMHLFYVRKERLQSTMTWATSACKETDTTKFAWVTFDICCHAIFCILLLGAWGK